MASKGNDKASIGSLCQILVIDDDDEDDKIQ